MLHDATGAGRLTPDQLLERINKAERDASRGRMKIFVGFAAGVGKTYAMLNEANRRKTENHQDIVIGYVETHGRKETISQIGDLEVVPRRKIEYRGAMFEEMDVDAILERNPAWVLIDELAHTNIPGSKHAKRYEDVLELLGVGISVLTTVNVQHLESLNDTVTQITGIKVRETVPDWILGEANEVVTIDVTPRALINRLNRGEVYSLEKVPQALSGFFKEGNLSALRELTLREVATEVDRSVQAYREQSGVEEAWRTNECVMVCISPSTGSDRLLRRGWRIARRMKAEIVAVYVENSKPNAEEQLALDRDYSVAKVLNIRIDKVQSKDIAGALIKYANEHQATEIVIGHSGRSSLRDLFFGNVIHRLISALPGADILVISSNRQAPKVGEAGGY
jgi:two-component system sensor histidine kinase KdpD